MKAQIYFSLGIEIYFLTVNKILIQILLFIIHLVTPLMKVSLDEVCCRQEMRKLRGKYRYHILSLLNEVLFFTIILVVYFPLHIKKIVSWFIFSEHYKAQNVHSLLEKEDFSSDCIIDLDTNLSPKYERRDGFFIIIPEGNMSQSGRKGEDSSSLGDNILPHKKFASFQLRTKVIFKPLVLPTILHQYLSKRFKFLPSFSLEEEDISAEQNILEFGYFLDRFQIIYEDMALRMFCQSLK